MNKRMLLTLLIALLIIIVPFVSLISYHTQSTAFKQNTILTEPIVDRWGAVSIIADPRLELLASVELNSGFYNIVKYDTEYKRNMKAHFKSVRNHEAVRLFKRLSKNGIYVDVPCTMMLHLSEVPELNIKTPIADNITNNFTKDEAVTDKFIEALRDYAKVSGIQDFIASHKEFYLSNIAKVKQMLMKNDYVEDIESYYGLKQKSYNIILSPLFEGNFGPRIERADGYDLYAIIGGSDVTEAYEEEELRYLIWHEFSHSFINPLSEETANKSRLNEYADNYESIRKEMTQKGYDSWINSVNEHVIRAVTVRLTYKDYGAEMADKLLNAEKERGFVYIDELCKRLEFYENNRDRYKTIVEFYPELIRVFEKKY